jgi:hypothetical protein
MSTLNHICIFCDKPVAVKFDSINTQDKKSTHLKCLGLYVKEQTTPIERQEAIELFRKAKKEVISALEWHSRNINANMKMLNLETECILLNIEKAGESIPDVITHLRENEERTRLIRLIKSSQLVFEALQNDLRATNLDI